MTIIYEVDGPRILGFNGLYCLLWDREQDLGLLKVNTKGGNRPVRAWYGQTNDSGAAATKQAFIAYAYGDCLAVAFKKAGSAEAAKTDLVPSLHGREIMAALSLA